MKIIRVHLFYLFALLITLAVSSPSEAQNVTGRIKCVVLDGNDARIPDATITIQDSNLQRRFMTDDIGESEVSVPSGTYQIIVEKANFRRFESGPLEMPLDAPETIRIHLEVQSIIDPLQYSEPLRTDEEEPKSILIQ